MKPSDDHLIRDAMAQLTVPHAARVVGLLGPRTSPTLALCRSPAAAAPSRGFGGRFHGGEALRQGLIRDSVAQQTGPDAAELVVVRRLNVAGFRRRFQTAVSDGGFRWRFHLPESMPP